jgi:hypothetical protein
MFQKLICALVLTPLLIVAGCGSDGNSTPLDPALLALGDCSAQAMEDMILVTDALPKLINTIINPLAPPDPDVTWNPLTGDFTLGIDVDGDTIADVTSTGTVSLLGDFSDGVQVGEGLSVAWSAVDPQLTGSGTFDFTLAPLGMMDITGLGSVSPDLTCTVDIPDIDLSINLLSPSTDPTGTVDFTTSNGVDDLTGTVTLNGTSQALVSALFNGLSVSFRIDLNTFIPIF